MSLEKNIQEMIEKKLNDGTVEKLVEDAFEKSINRAVEDLFSSYGEVSKVLKEQLKEVMVPYIEEYDFSEYITKVDHVLTELVKNSTKEHHKLLENFKMLMAPEKIEEIRVSEIFEIWQQFVAKEVDTSELEVHVEDEPYYQNVSVTLEVVEDDSRFSSSSFDYMNIVMQCEEDEKLKQVIPISRWISSYSNNEHFTVSAAHDDNISFKSLRHLDEFKCFVVRLSQLHTKIIVDTYMGEEEVEVQAEPEADFS